MKIAQVHSKARSACNNREKAQTICRIRLNCYLRNYLADSYVDYLAKKWCKKRHRNSFGVINSPFVVRARKLKRSTPRPFSPIVPGGILAC